MISTIQERDELTMASPIWSVSWMKERTLTIFVKTSISNLAMFYFIFLELQESTIATKEFESRI